jgi:hypothetical protein
VNLVVRVECLSGHRMLSTRTGNLYHYYPYSYYSWHSHPSSSPVCPLAPLVVSGLIVCALYSFSSNVMMHRAKVCYFEFRAFSVLALCIVLETFAPTRPASNLPLVPYIKAVPPSLYRMLNRSWVLGSSLEELYHFVPSWLQWVTALVTAAPCGVKSLQS